MIEKIRYWYLHRSPFVSRSRHEEALLKIVELHREELEKTRKTREFLEKEICRLSRVEVKKWNDTHIISITVSVSRYVLKNIMTRNLAWGAITRQIIEQVERKAGVSN